VSEAGRAGAPGEDVADPSDQPAVADEPGDTGEDASDYGAARFARLIERFWTFGAAPVDAERPPAREQD